MVTSIFKIYNEQRLYVPFPLPVHDSFFSFARISLPTSVNYPMVLRTFLFSWVYSSWSVIASLSPSRRSSYFYSTWKDAGKYLPMPFSFSSAVSSAFRSLVSKLPLHLDLENNVWGIFLCRCKMLREYLRRKMFESLKMLSTELELIRILAEIS